VTWFELSWPEQRAARVIRGPNGPLQPVRIVVNYSQGELHPHLSGSTAGFWPFQVTSEADAGRQKGVLAAIVELERISASLKPIGVFYPLMDARRS
jgi:hypothetical protein